MISPACSPACIYARDGPSPPPTMDTMAQYVSIANDTAWLSRMYIYFVNHRVYDVPDPLTYTLIQMATSPIQLSFRESGLLPLRTNELPVFPFTEMAVEHREALCDLLRQTRTDALRESAYVDGKINVSVQLKNAPTIDRKQLLLAFVAAVHERSNIPDPNGDVQQRFCRIIVQRFLSSVATPSAIVADVMRAIEGLKRDEPMCDE